MKKLFEHLFLLLCRLLPGKLARHAMFLLQSHPKLTDSWGVHVRGIHYYDPLPDFQHITAPQTRLRRERLAFDLNLVAQLELQRVLSGAAAEELQSLVTDTSTKRFPFDNSYFSKLDAAIYYALIRHLKPARVIEIGCGFSTRIADIALKRNRTEGHPGRLICIEPYPEARLTEFALEMELIQQPVQEVGLEMFRSLKSSDILFIDSSHVAKFQSDVCHEFLTILPTLAPGVWVHVHDIFFPADYPAEWLVEKRIAFNEQYLLEAFLALNPSFTAQCCLHALWLDHKGVMASMWPPACLPANDKLGAGSFWMKRVA